MKLLRFRTSVRLFQQKHLFFFMSVQSSNKNGFIVSKTLSFSRRFRAHGKKEKKCFSWQPRAVYSKILKSLKSWLKVKPLADQVAHNSCLSPSWGLRLFQKFGPGLLEKKSMLSSCRFRARRKKNGFFFQNSCFSSWRFRARRNIWTKKMSPKNKIFTRDGSGLRYFRTDVARCVKCKVNCEIRIQPPCTETVSHDKAADIYISVLLNWCKVYIAFCKKKKKRKIQTHIYWDWLSLQDIQSCFAWLGDAASYHHLARMEKDIRVALGMQVMYHHIAHNDDNKGK